MIRFIFILILVGVIISSCQKSDLNKEMRSPGEIAFRANCQTCHILPKATMKTDSEWPLIVSRYGEKAKLTKVQVNDIIAYLISQN